MGWLCGSRILVVYMFGIMLVMQSWGCKLVTFRSFGECFERGALGYVELVVLKSLHTSQGLLFETVPVRRLAIFSDVLVVLLTAGARSLVSVAVILWRIEQLSIVACASFQGYGSKWQALWTRLQFIRQSSHKLTWFSGRQKTKWKLSVFNVWGGPSAFATVK